MELILYSFMFIFGILCGSFYTLATHRIPKREDILYTNSYCPKCNHKLKFWDLIPVFSYIFLRGKCRHCGNKIKPKYLIYELLAGGSFVLFAYLINLNILNINLDFAVKLIFISMYSTLVFLVAGIDKQQKNIEKPVIGFGILISILYIVYLCIVENSSIYRYVIYIIAYILILALDAVKLNKYAKNSYANNIILLIITLAILTGGFIAGATVVVSSVAVILNLLTLKLKNKKKSLLENYKEIPIGFIVASVNYVTLLFALGFEKLYL